MRSKDNVLRTDEMIEVGYFLAKYDSTIGKGPRSKPPRELGNVNWNEAYDAFFAQLGDGRRKESFRNSLKNVRDTFDGHVDSSRQGWRQAQAARPAQTLSTRNREVFDRLEKKKRKKVWELVKPYTRPGQKELTRQVKKDITAQDAAKVDKSAKTEGGKKATISYRIERSSKLRAAALDHHGYACGACGFDFGAAYGGWGEGYAEVHHLVLLGGKKAGKRKTDPKKDLAVLCANCHRMAHRKKGIALTVSEIKKKLNRKYVRK